MESAAITVGGADGWQVPRAGAPFLRGLRAMLSRAAMAVALLLPASAVVGPVLTPAVAVAQDDLADEDVAQPEGENMLVFFYKALGPRYVVIFLLLSFALVALLVMCFLQIRREALMPKGLREGFEAHLDAKEFQQAYDLAKADDSYLGHVLAAGMSKIQSGHAAATEAMDEAAGEEQMKLEHKVSYVSLIGALAPMFGLLGTVDGMVSAFMVIAKSETQPKPSELAIGISQALITTLIGLWLAIPAIACYALFKNWMQTLYGDVEKETNGLMARFQNLGKK